MERFFFARVEVWLVLLLMLLAGVGGGVWAFLMIRERVFPYPQLTEVWHAAKGAEGDNRPLFVRLTGGLAFSPTELRATRHSVLLPDTAFTAVTPAASAPGPMPVTAGMRIANPEGGKRYFLVYGSFVFPELEVNQGIVLIDSQGELLRAWPISVTRGQFRGMHVGLALSDDGILATNARGILNAKSWCGKSLWEGEWSSSARWVNHDNPESKDWHHDITYANGAFHTFHGLNIVAVDAESGAVRSRLSALDLVRWAWRDGLSLFDTRAYIFDPAELNDKTAARLLGPDPFHMNKVDVMTADMVRDYPGLAAGDLLISFRELNLVVVVRPSEKRIVWWRYGLTSRQHDASFVDGAVEVFDNSPFTDPPHPTIRRLSMTDHSFETVADLSRWKMKMREKGNFVHHGDRLLTVEDDAGQMIAGRTDGTIDVLFENGYSENGDRTGLQLRNAIELTGAQIADFDSQCSMHAELSP